MKKLLKALIPIVLVLAFLWAVPASRDYMKLGAARVMALRGTPESYVRMGWALRAIERDSTALLEAKALPWFKRAAEAGDLDGMVSLAQYYNYLTDSGSLTEWEKERELRERYRAEGARWMLEAAQRGSAEAQYKLGYEYDEDSEAYEITPESLPWLVKAAEQKHEWAMDALAKYYADPDNPEQDLKQAANWSRQFKRAQLWSKVKNRLG
ncbi:MAG: hypothetical protein FWF60_06845 [Oscillospiraceae bacterium]|nr:hypothetical protein [Oscillospiraceae bacterium]